MEGLDPPVAPSAEFSVLTDSGISKQALLVNTKTGLRCQIASTLGAAIPSKAFSLSKEP